jgi:hypothetical protein
MAFVGVGAASAKVFDPPPVRVRLCVPLFGMLATGLP